MSTRGEPDAVDGRRARRERNRLAALDATYELFVEGQLLPSIEDVAARSGVSLRSLYRYFKDSDELHLAALARRAEVAEPLFALERVGRGSLDERIDRLVEQRLRLYEETAPTIRTAYAMAPSLPLLREQVDRRKAQLSAQLSAHFAVELDPLSRSARTSVLACADVLCQFEALEQMRSERGMSVAETRAAVAVGLRALLTVPPATEQP